MFSTFTGNSKRPRNVNLSGQVGNPFANTSWSPSVVSSATKTVSDAQADREKRQAERQRLKAAGKIQKTWRGHRTRSALADARRATFDELYNSASNGASPERLPIAFNLLCSFFSSRRSDDLPRLFQYIRDSETVDLSYIAPANVQPSRLQKLVTILVKSLQASVSRRYAPLATFAALERLQRFLVSAGGY